MSGKNEQGTPGLAVGDGLRGDQPARPPSLEEQTPGLDTDQMEQTDADAEAFFGGSQGSGGTQGGGSSQGGGAQSGGTENLTDVARAAGNGEGAQQGDPPGGDVRTVYENERQPGQAEPRSRQR